MDLASGSRISLPPIASLIDGPSNDLAENASEPSPQSAHTRKTSLPSPSQSQTHVRPSHVGSPRGLPPATPPLPPPSSFDFARHATLKSSPSATSAPASTIFAQAPPSTNIEPYSTRTSAYPSTSENHHLPPRTSAYPPIPESQAWQPQHSTQAPLSGTSAQEPPARHLQSSYPDPTNHVTFAPSQTQQRPLPPYAPPTYYGQPMPPIDPQMAPQWQQQQHPHYIPQHATPSYPQNQGGYPCASCSRIFSRPSSLRIHENSHTGAKPFACQYPGCNKRFSVRSNRKRHEKGCHERPHKENSGSEVGGSEAGSSLVTNPEA